jgi:hypothetical protein
LQLSGIVAGGAAHDPAHACPKRRAQAHRARLARGHDLVCGQVVAGQRVRADPGFGLHERDHFRVQHRVVERHHAVHARANQPARLTLENRGAERPALIAQHVVARQLNGEAHAVFGGGVALVEISDVADPARQVNADHGGIVVRPCRFHKVEI